MYTNYKTRRAMKHFFLVLLLAGAFLTEQAHADRVKDLASVAGVRENQLVGYGLVVGLDGSGDQTTQTPFTVQGIINMLTQFGVTVPPGTRMQLKNVAAVTIHAELPAFAKPGQKIDITVASIGNAKSLRGGVLLMAPLKGADGQVYAVAQGNVLVGGYSVKGRDGFEVKTSINSVGRIPDGAIIDFVQPGADYTFADDASQSLPIGTQRCVYVLMYDQQQVDNLLSEPANAGLLGILGVGLGDDLPTILSALINSPFAGALPGTDVPSIQEALGSLLILKEGKGNIKI